ncbi:unnamed protein product [Brachionus calyciflorus]|uniref:Coiled-coil domain-containing protein 86 n=1 Tax=Brachionus calyciflorus TaxID=104777 RepID=A0A814PBZ6_9BILA|nr:unnamed protein product [Brachionus calyciflorus]
MSDQKVETENPIVPTEELIKTKVEQEKEKYRSIPSGKFKSGRVWKENSHKFSNMTIQKPHRSSWEKKMSLKNHRGEIKKYEDRLKEEKKEKKLELVKRQKINEERRKENERKAEIVQTVKNKAKLKRIKKKMLRKVAAAKKSKNKKPN